MPNNLQEIKDFALRELAELFIALAYLHELPIAPPIRFRMYLTQEFALYEAVGHLLRECVNDLFNATPPILPTAEYLYATKKGNYSLTPSGQIQGKEITNGSRAHSNSMAEIFFSFRYAARLLAVTYDPAKITGYSAMLKYQEAMDRLTHPDSIAAFKVMASELNNFDKRLLWLTESLHALLPPETPQKKSPRKPRTERPNDSQSLLPLSHGKKKRAHRAKDPI